MAAWALRDAGPPGARSSRRAEICFPASGARADRDRCSRTTRSRGAASSRTRTRSSSRARAAPRPRPGGASADRSSATSTTCRRSSAAGRFTGTRRCRASGATTSRGARCTARCRARTSPTGRWTYDELEPFYDEVENRLGVQGDIARACRRATLAQAPRRHAVRDARRTRRCTAGTCSPRARAGSWYHRVPLPDGGELAFRTTAARACNSCGFCSGFGCPINARGEAAISFLHDAMPGRRGAAHALLRASGRPRRPAAAGPAGCPTSTSTGAPDRRADIVVLAPSAIETARLLLLSRRTDHPRRARQSLRAGRTQPDVPLLHARHRAVQRERAHAWRGPSTTFTIDDFVGPVHGGPARAAGLPYLKGGICEVGGGMLLLEEAKLYTGRRAIGARRSTACCAASRCATTSRGSS